MFSVNSRPIFKKCIFNTMNVYLEKKLKELGIDDILDYDYKSHRQATRENLVSAKVRGNVRMQQKKVLTEKEFLAKKESILASSRLLRAKI